jgi:beta-alanine--pyruvate transaminase
MKRLNDLESYWMPFTANRDFKKDPRMVVSADGMYYKSETGKISLIAPRDYGV